MLASKIYLYYEEHLTKSNLNREDVENEAVYL